MSFVINPLNAELNAICYLLTLLGAHPILHVSRIRVKTYGVWYLVIAVWIVGYLFLICSLRSAVMVVLQIIEIL
jgi:hypothetical protein